MSLSLSSTLASSLLLPQSSPAFPPELPYYLAAPLTKEGIIAPKIPEWFSDLFRAELKADPKCVNLKRVRGSWYDAVGMLQELIDDPEFTAVAKETIRDTFTSRMLQIIDLALSHTNCQNLSSEQNNAYSLMDDKEKKLFKIGVDAAFSMDRWVSHPEERNRIRKADLVHSSQSSLK